MIKTRNVRCVDGRLFSVSDIVVVRPLNEKPVVRRKILSFEIISTRVYAYVESLQVSVLLEHLDHAPLTNEQLGNH